MCEAAAGLGRSGRSAGRASRLTGLEYEILFLDAEDEVLVKRYKETRRTHPLARRRQSGARHPQKNARRLRISERVMRIIFIDTSQLLTRELKAELDKIFVKNLRVLKI